MARSRASSTTKNVMMVTFEKGLDGVFSIMCRPCCCEEPLDERWLSKHRREPASIISNAARRESDGRSGARQRSELRDNDGQDNARKAPSRCYTRRLARGPGRVQRVHWNPRMESSNYPRPVQPIMPAAPYIGGKRALSKRLVGLINATPHETYAEGFVGMGGVFLKRTRQPKAEVINDYSGDVANLFRILQRHYPQFMETLRFQVTSRREFERLARTDPTTLTDLERAARFLYLQRLAFGGKVAGRNFGVSLGRGASFNLTRLEPLLADIHERLAGVVIENLPWLAFVDRYDRPETLFYFDPPYWGSEKDYGATLFSRDQFELLADRLASLKGRFILSINDRSETRALFGRFHFEEVDLDYRVSGKPTAARELIVSG